jgi:hypothetical protein
MRRVLWLLIVDLAHIDLISALHMRSHDSKDDARANISNTLGCSVPEDVEKNHVWQRKHFDPFQRAKLMREGRIDNNSILTDVAFAHIPKNGGDAITNAFETLGIIMAGFWPSEGSECFYSQLPPQRLAIVNPAAAQQRFGGKDVFCVARDPYEKAISSSCHNLQFQFHVEPTLSLVNANIRRSLTAFRNGSYTESSCFWVPQVDYMKGQYGCKHVLDFRHLERDFNNFTKAHGYKLNLPDPSETHSCNIKCDWSKDDLQPDVQWLIKDTYREDFEQLGPRFGFKP